MQFTRPKRFVRAVQGACLILFFMFSEPIPFGSRLRDMPVHFSANWFIPDSARGAPMSWLFIPALVALTGAFMPILHRRWNWPAFVLLLPAIVFYGLIWGSHETLGGWYPWLILVLPFAGMNLWVRNVDYFFASSIAAMLWDGGAAARGLFLGLNWIPEPYAPHVPPLFSLAFDLTISVLLAIAWRRAAKMAFADRAVL
ncbi:MAG TPA: hypothetical protein VMT58_03985 [Candidatus Binataceae bacterium]|nr:hypothetical protein [Candidatus Binataceae bacterium]